MVLHLCLVLLLVPVAVVEVMIHITAEPVVQEAAAPVTLQVVLEVQEILLLFHRLKEIMEALATAQPPKAVVAAAPEPLEKTVDQMLATEASVFNLQFLALLPTTQVGAVAENLALLLIVRVEPVEEVMDPVQQRQEVILVQLAQLIAVAVVVVQMIIGMPVLGALVS
jgi:hypothetical protein